MMKKRIFSAVLLSAAMLAPAALQASAKSVTASSAKSKASASQKTKVLDNGYPFAQVPFTSVKIAQNTFWGARLKAAREVTVPLAFSKCESEHRYKNFEMAAYTLQHPGHAGLDTKEWDVSKFMGFSFDDTDVYKTIEGASYILQTYPDKKMKAYIDSVLNVVGAAQEPDGYLYTARTINPKHPHGWSGATRWSKVEVLSHELYNLGHMVDAACAHYQATGSRKFLDIAKRYADCVIREVGPQAGQHRVVPGHQIAEMALARLYTLTGEKKYLDYAMNSYKWSRDTLAGGLFNKKEGLWWRDKDYVPPYKEKDGSNCYWSRGNGWVYAALVRVMQTLPKTDKNYQYLKKDFISMSKAILKCQREDGYWNVSLVCPANYGGPEMTGTGLFLYGMAWGVQQGILPRATYQKAMDKAWKALAASVHEDGFIGYNQGTGKDPAAGQPVTFTSVPDFEDYGTGCLLLGAAEYYKLLKVKR